MICGFSFLGDVPVGSHGPPWGRKDGHIKKATEQIQLDQYDLSTGIVVAHVLSGLHSN